MKCQRSAPDDVRDAAVAVRLAVPARSGLVRSLDLGGRPALGRERRLAGAAVLWLTFSAES